MPFVFPKLSRFFSAAPLIFCLLLSACGSEEAQVESRKNVRAVEVRLIEAQNRQSYTGVVRARTETPVSFQVSGKMSRRMVDVGAAVKKGDVLAELDRQDFDLSLLTASAALRAAEARVIEASEEEERHRILLKSRHISQSTYDKVLTALRTAEEALRAAKAQETLARNQVGYATLRADADGFITAAMAEPGQVIAAGQPILSLARSDGRDVVIAVPENRINGINRAQASVTLWSQPDQSFPATVREISPQADPVTRTYTIRLTLDPMQKPAAANIALRGSAQPASAADLAAQMTLGASASVTIITARSDQVVSLPLSAVWYKGEQPHVWVVDEAKHRPQARSVSVIELKDNAAWLSEGVKEGEKVITLGVHRLDEQTPIQVEVQ